MNRIRTSRSGFRAVLFFFFLAPHTHTQIYIFIFVGVVEKKVAPILGPIQWQLLVP